MASTDAIPVPRKNVAFRWTFALYKNDGTLITGAAGLDSEVSKDGGTFADCTNEATEIATASGVYFLDLTSTEMNADCVSIVVKTSSTGACLPTIVMYPQETGDIKVDVTSYGGSAGTFASGRPEVNTTHIAGSIVDTTTAQIGVDVRKFGGTAGSFAAGIPDVALTSASRTATAGAVWDVSQASHVASGSFGAQLQTPDTGTAQAGAGTTITLRAGASATNDFYKSDGVYILSGTGAGQFRFITAYVGATKVATVSAWAVNPDNTSVYTLIPFGAIAGATAPTASENAIAVWDEARASHTAAGSFGQYFSQVFRANTAQSGTASSITLDAGASATNDLYKYGQISIVSGTGAGQSRQINGYTGSSKVATVGVNWTTTPDNTSVFLLTPLGVDAATVTSIAAAVWDELRASHGTAGTYGEYVFADAVRISGNATAAANAKSAFDGATGYGFTACTMPTTTNLTNTVTLGTGAHGGAAATLTLKSVAVSNSDAAGSAVSLTGAGTGASHALKLTSTSGQAIDASTSSGIGFKVVSSTGHGLSIQGGTNSDGIVSAGNGSGVDIRGNITGTLSELSSAVADSIPADGSRPSIKQALYMITQFLLERQKSGVTVTVMKPDGTTPLFTMTLDDATNPSTTTRAT